jgi:glycosyltransferase involved in cell wall biosynthesis
MNFAFNKDDAHHIIQKVYNWFSRNFNSFGGNSNKQDTIYSRRRVGNNFSLEKLDKSPLVTVIMTSYNTEEYISGAIDSILNQTYKNIELVIVDDCSTDGSRVIIDKYTEKFNTIRSFCFGENRGTYWSKNYGITKSSGEIITFMDSDDISINTRIEEQVAGLNNKGVSMVTVNMNRVDSEGNIILINGNKERVAPISKMVRKDIFSKIGFFDTVRTSADDEFMQRVKLAFGKKSVVNIQKPLYIALLRDGSLTLEKGNEIDLKKPREKGKPFLPKDRQYYLDNYQDWHRLVSGKGSVPFMPFPVVNRPFNISGKLIVADGRYDGNEISVCIASFPERISKLRKVIESILPQTDKIYVYLNEYKDVPAFLKHPRIITQLGIHAEGDLRDNGKFFFVNQIPNGYCLTIDDDINYPNDYVQSHIRKLELYERKAITGIHGTIFEKPFVSYFQKRDVYHFRDELKRDVVVNQLGTGTTAFHTSLIKPDVLKFRDMGMVDVFLALLSNDKKIPLICIEREKLWLSPMKQKKHERNLFDEFVGGDDKQTEYISNICPLSEYIEGDLNESLKRKSEKFGKMFYANIPQLKK